MMGSPLAAALGAPDPFEQELRARYRAALDRAQAGSFSPTTTTFDLVDRARVPQDPVDEALYGTQYRHLPASNYDHSGSMAAGAQHAAMLNQARSLPAELLGQQLAALGGHRGQLAQAEVDNRKLQFQMSPEGQQMAAARVLAESNQPQTPDLAAFFRRKLTSGMPVPPPTPTQALQAQAPGAAAALVDPKTGRPAFGGPLQAIMHLHERGLIPPGGQAGPVLQMLREQFGQPTMADAAIPYGQPPAGGWRASPLDAMHSLLQEGADYAFQQRARKAQGSALLREMMRAAAAGQPIAPTR